MTKNVQTKEIIDDQLHWSTCHGKGNQAKKQNSMSMIPRLALTLRLIGSSLPVSLYASIAFSHANTGP